MKSWQEDLLEVTEDALCEREVFARVETAALALGFEQVAYGFRAPLPVTNSILVSDFFFNAIHDAPSVQASGIGVPALSFLKHSHPALHAWGRPPVA